MAGARPPDAAAARRFCALPRDLQGSAVRTREGPCGGCGRAAGSAGANGHGRVCRSARPWPRVRVVSVHDRRGVRSSGRGRARRRDGLALPHPTSHGRALASFLCTAAAAVRGGGRAGGSAGANAHGPPPMAAFAAARAHGRAFAALLCTIAAGVCSSGRGRARRRDGLALPHPTSHGRAFASFLCTIAAGVRSSGRRRAAAEGRAGASSPHIPRPRVRIVSVHDRRRRAAAAGRAGASSPHIPRPRVRSVPVHGRRGVRSSGRAFAALKFIPCAGRICAYSRCAAAASASAQSVRSQGRSRSARPKWP